MTSKINSSAVTSAGSLLSTPVTVALTNINTSVVILPLVGQLPAGQYSSKIQSVSETIYMGKPVIDCVHELTSNTGKVYYVKFRYFSPFDTNNLIDTMASYKLSGNLGDVLIGLAETVDVAPRYGSERYMEIVGRSLLVTSASSTSASTGITKQHHHIGNPSRKAADIQVKKLSLDDPEFDDFLEDDDE